MALYAQYLVCYDIVNNKVRQRFYKELKALGLMPLQKSVFWGQLNQAEYRSMQRSAFDLLDSTTDKCFWIHTQLKEDQLKVAIGYKDLEVVNADGYHSL